MSSELVVVVVVILLVLWALGFFHYRAQTGNLVHVLLVVVLLLIVARLLGVV